MTKHIPATIDELIARKTEILQEIQKQKMTVDKLGKSIISPIVPTAARAGNIAKCFNKGMLVLEGFMLGLKFIRRFRKLFKRK